MNKQFQKVKILTYSLLEKDIKTEIQISKETLSLLLMLIIDM